MNNDLISREALKKAISNSPLIDFTDDDIFEIIDNLPTVKTYCYFCGQTEHGQKGGAT